MSGRPRRPRRAIPAVVFVNKVVFKRFSFHFPLALCFLHLCITSLGLELYFLALGAKKKPLPWASRVYVGACYAAFVSSSVLSIQLNPVGQRPSRGCSPAHGCASCCSCRERLGPRGQRPAPMHTPHAGIYQITRTLPTPIIVLLELCLYAKVPSLQVNLSIALLMAGVTIFTGA